MARGQTFIGGLACRLAHSVAGGPGACEALCISSIAASPGGSARLPATLGAPGHLHEDVEAPPELQAHD